MLFKFATAIPFLLLVSLVGASHNVSHGESHVRRYNHRGISVEVITITEVVYVTFTGPPLTTISPPAKATVPEKNSPADKVLASLSTTNPVASRASSPATSSTLVGNPYKTIAPAGGSASVVNSCDYAVYVESVGQDSCDKGGQRQLVGPRSSYTEKIRSCISGGISLKVSKSDTMQNPMQFEYTVWDNKATVSYDISFLDCLKNDHGQKDLSACAGAEKGIQAVAGVGHTVCPNYFCLGGEWCDQQAYVVAEFDYKPGAPVGACPVDQGLAFELCAGNR